MSRCVKIFILSLISLIALAVPVFAKEMTIDELGAEAAKIYEKDSSKTVSYIYIVGEYAFTSQHTLTTQDVMLAARDIDVKNTDGGTADDDIYNEMTINVIEGEVDSTGKVSSWITEDNELGTTELEDMVNIRYIDYNFIKEDTEFSIGLEQLKQDEYKNALSSEQFNFEGGNDKNSVNLQLKDGKLTGLIKKNTGNVGGFSDDDKTGYYFAFVVEVPNAREETTVSIKGKKETKATYENFDNKKDGKQGMACLMSLDPESKNKTISVVVDLDGEGDEYNPQTRTIDWSGLDFQYESECTKANIGNGTDTPNQDGYISSEDKSQVQSWGFDFENAGKNLKINAGSDKKSYSLSGKVKEQTVGGAGFSEAKGYYVVVKIYGPDEQQAEKYDYLPQNGNLKKWTIRLKDEQGNYKEPAKPTDNDYNNGFITSLIKLKQNGDGKITYQIDWDGDGDYFLPYEETIDYSQLEFLEAHEVSFEGMEDKITVWDEDEITEDMIPKKELETDTYHKFAYWNTKDGTAFTGATIDDSILDDDGNISLVPHWNLYSDKFVSDVIADLNSTEPTSKSGDFHDKFILEQDENDSSKIKIKVVDPEATVDIMNTTSIPGAIAYPLIKNEIKEITLEVNEQNKITFNKDGVAGTNGISLASEEVPDGVAELKEKVKDGIKTLYGQVLGDGQDATTTLSEMASGKNASFKIKIGTTDKTVSLANENKEGDVVTVYTFTFDSSIAVVSSKEELQKALESSKITDILVKKGFEVNSQSGAEAQNTLKIDIQSRQVKIASLDSDNPQTISNNGSNVASVFEVKSGNITFEDLKIEGAKKAISVKSGATVTAKNISAVDSQDAGFEVETGAKLIGTGLKYLKTADGDVEEEKESYHCPTICGKGTVNITDKQPVKINEYERVVHAPGAPWTEEDFKDPETHNYFPDFVDGEGKLKEDYSSMIGTERNNHNDMLTNTHHTHYYLEEANSKVYQIYFWDAQLRLVTWKYYAKGDTVVPPVDNSYQNPNEHMHFFKKAIKVDDNIYVHDGWSKMESLGNGTDPKGINTPKADLEVPTSGDSGVYYNRYVPGYRVKIQMTSKNGEQVTGIFGIVKPDENGNKVKISDLMDKDEEFKKAFEALVEKAEKENKKVVDTLNNNAEITKDTEISTNDMNLEIGENQ